MVLDAFVDPIEGAEPAPATTRDALRTTAATEAAYESARTGIDNGQSIAE